MSWRNLSVIGSLSLTRRSIWTCLGDGAYSPLFCRVVFLKSNNPEVIEGMVMFEFWSSALISFLDIVLLLAFYFFTTFLARGNGNLFFPFAAIAEIYSYCDNLDSKSSFALFFDCSPIWRAICVISLFFASIIVRVEFLCLFSSSRSIEVVASCTA